MKTSYASTLLLLLGCAPYLCAAETGTITAAATPEEMGLAVAREVDRRDSGWHDYEATVVMVLKNSHGEESVRELRFRFLEGMQEGDKSLAVFDTPKDVKGTALLTHTRIDGQNDQWLFLPALNRVKRIASANQSGPFLGSEFAYEDLAAAEVDKYSYRCLSEQDYEGLPCFVVERCPRVEDSGYSRQVVWIDGEAFRIQKVDYYDRKGSLLKTLTIPAYRLYLDRYWRAEQLTMVNHQTGKSTLLFWKNVVFRNGFTDRDFDQSGLARMR